MAATVLARAAFAAALLSSACSASPASLLRGGVRNAASAANAAADAADADAAPRRPSFVFLLSESLDGRLLREGSAARIPNIRALLAAGSVRFDSAYSNSPVCAPARSALHSGRDVHRIAHQHNGMRVNGAWNNFEGLDANYSGGLLHERLAAAGYATQVFGKTDWTVGGHSLTCELSSLTFNIAWPYNITADGGWNEEDNFCASDGPVAPGGSNGPSGSTYPSDWSIMDKTAKFAATAPQPYYVFAGTSILHPPYQTSAYWYNVAADRPLPTWPALEDLHPCDLQAAMKRGCTPGEQNASARADFYDPERIRRVRRVYLAELEEFDAMVGSVVAALDAAGRWRDGSTTVVLAADHGDMQLEHQLFYKMLGYDASARVPLAFASPALAGLGAKVVAQPASLLDIFPTLLGLANASVPDFADGYDLAPFFAPGVERDSSRPPAVSFQNHDEDISMSWFAVSNGSHKLIQFGTGAQVAPQLFDLEADPDELTNLHNASAAARAAEAALDAQLRALINYPSVAQDVADYQLAQFKFWAESQADWRAEIASGDVRWQAAWAAHPAAALAAAEAYLAQAPPAAIRPCDGATAANLGGAAAAAAAAT